LVFIMDEPCAFCEVHIKGKGVSLQAPEGSRKLRFPDFVTTAEDSGR